MTSEPWMNAFFAALRPAEIAEPLKQAALSGQLAEWTKQLTAVVVRACEATGWRAAAKGFPLDLLPQIGQEYLGMDVMAFIPPTSAGSEEERSRPKWHFPVAVFELENRRDDDRVAYSLWKVMCIRAALRVVFAYRDDWEEGKELIRHLTDHVIGRMTIDERTALTGETLVILGSRGEGETFPHGYFKMWRLDTNVGRFEKV